MGAIKHYYRNISNAVTTIFEGMAVTMSWMFREPSTIQYPYHPSRPSEKLGGPETLAARYRGLLEVDMDICTACLACEKACPIDCIRIDVQKIQLTDDEDAKPVRAMRSFDIDMAKCMYCGLCSEPCPTNAIRHTKEFESSVAHLEHLTARFVEREKPVVPFKVKKTEDFGTAEYGEIAHSLYVTSEWNRAAIDFPALPRTTKKKTAIEFPDWFSQPLSTRALSAQGVTKPKLALILEEAMAGTDCGACQYPTCREYSEAISTGACNETTRCEPGGIDSALEAGQILAAWKELDPETEKAKKAKKAPLNLEKAS